jgi:hypothetical protein
MHGVIVCGTVTVRSNDLLRSGRYRGAAPFRAMARSGDRMQGLEVWQPLSVKLRGGPEQLTILWLRDGERGGRGGGLSCVRVSEIAVTIAMVLRLCPFCTGEF